MTRIEDEGVGGVKKASLANYMHSDARMNTEAKMAAEIAANKAKANNAQNTGAGTSTNQTDYNRKASDEISIGQTNMDGTAVVGNNIRTGDQTNFGGNSDGGATGGGKSDQVAAIKLATSDKPANLVSFEFNSKKGERLANNLSRLGVSTTEFVAQAINKNDDKELDQIRNNIAGVTKLSVNSKLKEMNEGLA